MTILHAKDEIIPVIFEKDILELPQDIMKGPQETCEPAGSHGYDLAWLVSPKQREIKQHDPVNNEIKDCE